MKDFDDLSRFLCDWYECSEEDLAGHASAAVAIRNPILRDFYERFGELASESSRFRQPADRLGPLSAQNHFSPITAIPDEDGFEVFLIENQGVFAAAAGGGPFLHLKGDVEPDRFLEFTPIKIPLVESMIAGALQETVLAAGDRYANSSEIPSEEYRKTLASARTFQLRFVHIDHPLYFFLAPDLIGMGFDETPEFFACRGDWRRPPWFARKQR